VECMTILRLMLKEGIWHVLDQSGSLQGPVLGSFEHSNETPGFRKDEECVHQHKTNLLILNSKV
jgi:hypothetical protein